MCWQTLKASTPQSWTSFSATRWVDRVFPLFV
jgi:hypothetical protein